MDWPLQSSGLTPADKLRNVLEKTLHSGQTRSSSIQDPGETEHWMEIPKPDIAGAYGNNATAIKSWNQS